MITTDFRFPIVKVNTGRCCLPPTELLNDRVVGDHHFSSIWSSGRVGWSGYWWSDFHSSCKRIHDPTVTSPFRISFSCTYCKRTRFRHWIFHVPFNFKDEITCLLSYRAQKGASGHLGLWQKSTIINSLALKLGKEARFVNE